ncbi:DUF7345 domain-containing protein [Halostagnicola bangensis]
MRGTIAVAGLVSLVLLSAVATPVAGSSGMQDIADPAGSEEPSLHVQLSDDGDATVTLVSVYDITDSDERESFESIRADEGTQAELLERFTDRLESVSAEIDTSDNTSIAGDEVNLRSADDRGIVSLSVTWHELAAVDGDSLVVDEPFASGFETDRPLVLEGPTGSTLESSTPEPTVADGERAMWETETELDGFEAVVAPASEESENEVSDGEETESDGTPGFGGIVAVGSIVVLLGLRLR